MDKTIVTFKTFQSLIEKVIKQIELDKTFKPDTILALSTGGFPVAAALAKKLGVKSRNVIGMPVYKDESGDYHLDDQLITLGDCTNRQVLIVDEASKRGILTQKAVTIIENHGGKAKSCVLIAWKEGIQPDYIADTCLGNPPDFFWEV